MRTSQVSMISTDLLRDSSESCTRSGFHTSASSMFVIARMITSRSAPYQSPFAAIIYRIRGISQHGGDQALQSPL